MSDDTVLLLVNTQCLVSLCARNQVFFKTLRLELYTMFNYLRRKKLSVYYQCYVFELKIIYHFVFFIIFLIGTFRESEVIIVDLQFEVCI